MSPGPSALSFSESNSADIFAQRLASTREEPSPRILTVAGRHLHDLIREFRPTPDEWKSVIAFLTDVGMLLRQLGYPLRRPAHRHFIVSAPGAETITTHLYDSGDPHIDRDTIFGIKQELIVDFSGGWIDFTFTTARSRRGART